MWSKKCSDPQEAWSSNVLDPRLLSTVEAAQYSGGCSVQWRANISTVEVVQYCGGLTSVQWRANIQYSGGCAVQCRLDLILIQCYKIRGGFRGEGVSWFSETPPLPFYHFFRKHFKTQRAKLMSFFYFNAI